MQQHLFPGSGYGKWAQLWCDEFSLTDLRGMVALNQMNIANDAMYRAVQVANNMRAQGMVIYSIVLGNKITEAFLQQIANDPASSTFNASEPVGQAVFAPTANDLDAVFQSIASEILLRLSQ